MTYRGNTFLWIAFFGLFLPTVHMFKQAINLPEGKRYFHYVSALICGIASVAYLAMASGNGAIYVFGADNKYRQFLYARYIDWAFTTPLQLLDLAGLAGASYETTFTLIALDVLMIVCGLIGALIGGSNSISFLFWGLGMLCFFPIVHILGFSLPGFLRPSNKALPGPTGPAQDIYRKVSKLTIIFWSAYPVVWVLCEGSSTVGSDFEAFLYTFLDIVAKSVFGLLITGARDGLDQALAQKKSASLIASSTPSAINE